MCHECFFSLCYTDQFCWRLTIRNTIKENSRVFWYLDTVLIFTALTIVNDGICNEHPLYSTYIFLQCYNQTLILDRRYAALLVLIQFFYFFLLQRFWNLLKLFLPIAPATYITIQFLPKHPWCSPPICLLLNL